VKGEPRFRANVRWSVGASPRGPGFATPFFEPGLHSDRFSPNSGDIKRGMEVKDRATERPIASALGVGICVSAFGCAGYPQSL
jgi:hypothetical protein